jgi:hypothetical protein
MDPAVVERVRSLVRRGIDWVYLRRMARPHGVVPLLYRNLRAACPDLVPGDVLNKFASYSDAVACANALMTAELVRLLNLCAAHGIQATPFKGPVLAALAYGDLSLREFSDLDILVHRREVLTLKNLLLTMGYRHAPRSFINHHYSTEAPDPAQDASFLNPFRLNYDCVLDRFDRKVCVELHWALLPWYFSFPLDTDRLWDRLVTVSLGSTTVRHLPPEDLLLYLCVHGAKHGWDELKWVCDIAELVRSHPQMAWGSLMEHAGVLGSRRMLGVGLALARDLLQAPISEGVLKDIRADATIKALVRWAAHRLCRPPGRPSGLAQRRLPLLGRTLSENWFYLRTKERLRDKGQYFLGLVIGLILEGARKDRLRERLQYCFRWVSRYLPGWRGARASASIP